MEEQCKKNYRDYNSFNSIASDHQVNEFVNLFYTFSYIYSLYALSNCCYIDQRYQLHSHRQVRSIFYKSG